MVRWAGCSATLTVSDEHSPFESMYSPEQHRLYFGTKPIPGLSPDMPLQILMHEVSHCLKAQEGLTFLDYLEDPKKYELEADERGAGLLCAYHKDGARINHALLVLVHDKYGYNGDEGHGTLAERIQAGSRASACHPSNLETP